MSHIVYQNCMHNTFDRHLDRHPNLPRYVEQNIEAEDKAEFEKANIRAEQMQIHYAKLLTKDVKQRQIVTDSEQINYAVYKSNIDQRRKHLQELYQEDFQEWKHQLRLEGYDLELEGNWKNENNVRGQL